MVFQDSYKLRNIVGLPEMHTDTPRLALHATPRVVFLTIYITACIGCCLASNSIVAVDS